MIAPGTQFAVERLPLGRIVATMSERRYAARVLAYEASLRAHPEHDVLVHVAPLEGVPGYYRLLDGHHRWLASHFAARPDVLALIISEPAPEASQEASASHA